MRQIVDEGYRNWLYGQISEGQPEYSNYKYMLDILENTEFKVYILMDENRVGDGVSLYNNFYHGQKDFSLFNREECSVLEMLVGLAYRCDDVMSDQTKGCRVIDWFWRFVHNLGLDTFTDDLVSSNPELYLQEMHQIVNRFVERGYDYNGKGGIFPLKNPPSDERKVEIWYQMMAWLNENFPV